MFRPSNQKELLNGVDVKFVCIHFDFDNYKPDLMERGGSDLISDGIGGEEEMQEMQLKGFVGAIRLKDCDSR